MYVASREQRKTIPTTYICPEEAHRELVIRYFRSGVRHSSLLKVTNNIDKLSGLKEKTLPVKRDLMEMDNSTEKKG